MKIEFSPDLSIISCYLVPGAHRCLGLITRAQRCSPLGLLARVHYCSLTPPGRRHATSENTGVLSVLQKPRNAGTYNSRQKPYLQTILQYLQTI